MEPVAPRIYLEPANSPDSPRERELRLQLHATRERLAAQRNHYETVIEQMRQKAEKPSALADAHAGIRNLRADKERLERGLEQAAMDRQILEARLAAGAERRKDAIICLNALLTCEDDNLSDEAYDKRMDTVIKHARRIVGAERAAKLAERGTK